MAFRLSASWATELAPIMTEAPEYCHPTPGHAEELCTVLPAVYIFARFCDPPPLFWSGTFSALWLSYQAADEHKPQYRYKIQQKQPCTLFGSVSEKHDSNGKQHIKKIPGGQKIYSCLYDLKCFHSIILPFQMKNIPFPQYIIMQTFFHRKELTNAKNTTSLQSLLCFVFRPVSAVDILSLCDECSLSILIARNSITWTILQICLAECSPEMPYKADSGSFTAYFDPAFFRERRAGIPESQQLQLLLYNRLTQTTAYLCCRQICPIDLLMSSWTCLFTAS